MSTVGSNILRIRKQLGITQEELAKRMGYKSKSTINKIELGINDIPQSKILQFAEVLGTTPGVLMGWSEMPSLDLQLFAQKENSPAEPEQSEEEKALLKLFRQIPKDQRKVFLEMGRVYANSLKKD
jgi:transcriptional regulator with XRE-family HTH domain